MSEPKRLDEFRAGDIVELVSVPRKCWQVLYVGERTVRTRPYMPEFSYDHVYIPGYLHAADPAET